MKNLLIILIGLIMLYSCDPPQNNKQEITQKAIDELKVYNFNGHQYIGHLSRSSSDFLTHSGECPNPIHFRTIHDTIFVDIKTKKVIK